jgi:biopolymer transport protein TolR
MPATVSRGGARRRRTINEINMVPFIDVMLVLLIIFMVSAPLITTGVVDLPSIGQAQARAASVVEVVVGGDQKLRIRLDQRNPEPVTLAQLGARVRALQGGNADMPVVISADKAVRYEAVMQVMDALQRAGTRRIALTVRQDG